jgi:hypothetical protein
MRRTPLRSTPSCTPRRGEASLAGWRAGAALALVEDGRGDEARELVLAEDFQSIPWDQAWSSAMFVWAIVCSRLRVVERAGELYELLATFAGQLAATPGNVFGTLAGALGALAGTLGRYDEAEVHFAAAAEIEDSFGASMFLAHTHARWAHALIARGRPEDLDRAQPILENAHEAAIRLNAEGITREITECRDALAALSR